MKSVVIKYINLASLSAFYFGAGLNHFWMPDFYLRMMPDYLPWHRELVYLSGVCEMLFGLLVLPNVTRRVAGVGLVLLLVAVFPANLHMAMHAERFDVSAAILWLRLPFQGVLIYWAYRSTCCASAPSA